MNKQEYIIRRETPADYRNVENMVREAFWNHYFPGCYEHYFVHTMRNHPDFIADLDFVIEVDGNIIGCVMYLKGKLIDENGTVKQVLTMGPLAVHPDYQRRHYGKALLEHSFAVAKQLGYDIVVNFGSPANYVARGYQSCLKYNICLAGDVYPMALLVKPLCEGVFDGRKWYYYPSDAEAVCEDETAVAAFDALFPPKEKAWQPSQEEFFIHCHATLQ